MSLRRPQKRQSNAISSNAPSRPRAVYPFAAIVGQEEMKLSLLLNVIDPHIGGVLVMGHRGTGKSTTIRALADLLPPITKVKDCAYSCDPKEPALLCRDCMNSHHTQGRLPQEKGPTPVVELPLGATEDRVCGTLNIERALSEGTSHFQPGLLARANRGFLYIDEVNLLEDHLVDLLLDVAASGCNIVEREGISIGHPARFVLVGSGNPEEGELRPQLIDRFGLHAQIETITDIEARVEIIQRRERYERDPVAFCAEMEPSHSHLRQQISRAQQLIHDVTIARDLLRQIAELCLQLKIDGHRGELTIVRAAKALAAFNGRREVSSEDVRSVAVMSLRHRLRKDPLGEIDSGTRVEQALENVTRDSSHVTCDLNHEPPTSNIEAVESYLPEDILSTPPQNNQSQARKPAARRKGTKADVRTCARGRYVSFVAGSPSAGKIAVDATLRAAILNQLTRHAPPSNMAVNVTTDDIRLKRFKQKTGMLIVFVVDASGSMAVNRMNQAKGAVTRLLQQAYVHRDKVALISFRGEGAEVLLPPSRSVERAKRALDALPVGGGTPLAAGLVAAYTLIQRSRKTGVQVPMLVLLTDGRGNVMNRSQESGARSQNEIWHELQDVCIALQAEAVNPIVIDTQNRFTATGEGERLAELLGGRYILLPRPGVHSVYETVAEVVETTRKQL